SITKSKGSTYRISRYASRYRSRITTRITTPYQPTRDATRGRNAATNAILVHPAVAGLRTVGKKFQLPKKQKKTDSLMKQTIKKSSISADPSEVLGINRRSFLTRASVAGAIVMSPFSALANARGNDDDNGALKEGDKAILIAAEIAEA